MIKAINLLVGKVQEFLEDDTKYSHIQNSKQPFINNNFTQILPSSELERQIYFIENNTND